MPNKLINPNNFISNIEKKLSQNRNSYFYNAMRRFEFEKLINLYLQINQQITTEKTYFNQVFQPYFQKIAENLANPVANQKPLIQETLNLTLEFVNNFEKDPNNGLLAEFNSLIEWLKLVQRQMPKTKTTVSEIVKLNHRIRTRIDQSKQFVTQHENQVAQNLQQWFNHKLLLATATDAYEWKKFLNEKNLQINRQQAESKATIRLVARNNFNQKLAAVQKEIANNEAQNQYEISNLKLQFEKQVEQQITKIKTEYQTKINEINEKFEQSIATDYQVEINKQLIEKQKNIINERTTTIKNQFLNQKILDIVTQNKDKIIQFHPELEALFEQNRTKVLEQKKAEEDQAHYEFTQTHFNAENEIEKRVWNQIFNQLVIYLDQKLAKKINQTVAETIIKQWKFDLKKNRTILEAKQSTKVNRFINTTKDNIIDIFNNVFIKLRNEDKNIYWEFDKFAKSIVKTWCDESGNASANQQSVINLATKYQKEFKTFFAERFKKIDWFEMLTEKQFQQLAKQALQFQNQFQGLKEVNQEKFDKELENQMENDLDNHLFKNHQLKLSSTTCRNFNKTLGKFVKIANYQIKTENRSNNQKLVKQLDNQLKTINEKYAKLSQTKLDEYNSAVRVKIQEWASRIRNLFQNFYLPNPHYKPVIGYQEKDLVVRGLIEKVIKEYETDINTMQKDVIHQGTGLFSDHEKTNIINVVSLKYEQTNKNLIADCEKDRDLEITAVTKNLQADYDQKLVLCEKVHQRSREENGRKLSEINDEYRSELNQINDSSEILVKTDDPVIFQNAIIEYAQILKSKKMAEQNAVVQFEAPDVAEEAFVY